MNIRTLKILSSVMVVLAIGLGMYAYRLSLSRTPVPHPQPEATFKGKVVVAVQPIEEGKPVPAEAVSLEPVTVVPEESFSQVEEVIGKEMMLPIAMGEPLTAKHFRASMLAVTLQPGERAVAVQVDGVVGAGGFVQPGDYVDVLLYLQDDNQENNNTQARVLLRCLRVMTFGVNLKGKREEKPSLDARTAVLAVSEADTTKLMLGASAGRLRLALIHPQVCSGEPTIAEAGEVTEASLMLAKETNGNGKSKANGVAHGNGKSKVQSAVKPQQEMIVTLRQLAMTKHQPAPQARRAVVAARPRPAQPKDNMVIYRGTEKELVNY
ncbi:MAG: Flp pilus assembly protein CpaB [Candidatus Binatia bacterium]